MYIGPLTVLSPSQGRLLKRVRTPQLTPTLMNTQGAIIPAVENDLRNGPRRDDLEPNIIYESSPHDPSTPKSLFTYFHL